MIKNQKVRKEKEEEKKERKKKRKNIKGSNIFLNKYLEILLNRLSKNIIYTSV